MKKSLNREAMPLSLPESTTGGDAYLALPQLMDPDKKRVLLIGGEKALANGLAPLKQALKPDVLLSVLPFSGGASLDKARDYAKAAKDLGADYLFGMGGGRALDTVKAAASLAGKPMMSFPTISATCAAVTRLCVFNDVSSGFDHILYLDKAPEHIFLHTGILSRAPAQYLRAGIGDSLAKAVESALKAKGSSPDYRDSLGLNLAQEALEGLIFWGEQALSDNKQGIDSPAFREAAQRCILSIGFTSLLVEERLNGALAHSLYYAMEKGLPLPKELLHGDIVAWGSLIQLQWEGKTELLTRLRNFLKRLGTPINLGQMGIKADSPEMAKCLEMALLEADMQELSPKPAVPELLEALARVETQEEVSDVQ